MSVRSSFILCATLLLISICSARAGAQVASVIYSPGLNQVRVSFTDDITAITLSNTLVFFENDSGRIVQVLCDASRVPNIANAVALSGFRDLTGTPVSLMRGGGIVSGVPPSKARTYNIVLKGLQLTREPRARPIQTSVEVNSTTNKAPILTIAPINNAGTAAIPYNRRIINIHPEGLTSTALLSRFQAVPGAADFDC